MNKGVGCTDSDEDDRGGTGSGNDAGSCVSTGGIRRGFD